MATDEVTRELERIHAEIADVDTAIKAARNPEDAVGRTIKLVGMGVDLMFALWRYRARHCWSRRETRPMKMLPERSVAVFELEQVQVEIAAIATELEAGGNLEGHAERLRQVARRVGLLTVALGRAAATGTVTPGLAHEPILRETARLDTEKRRLIEAIEHAKNPTNGTIDALGQQLADLNKQLERLRSPRARAGRLTGAGLAAMSLVVLVLAVREILPAPAALLWLPLVTFFAARQRR